MEFSLRGYLSAGVAFARDAVLRYGGSQSLVTLARLQLLHRAPFLALPRTHAELPIGSLAEGDQQTLQQELQAGLVAQRIIVDYSPVISLATDRIVRFEAVPKLETDKGWVTSERLNALAERVGLSDKLDEQVLNRACRDAREWPKEIPVAVRVSGGQAQASRLETLIFAALASSGLKPERLNVELDEAALGKPVESVKRLIDRLRKGSVKVVLDDFGTGYASLTQLLDLQFDRLKIDRRFVDRLDDADSAIIVRAIIRLASDFGIEVTAKGVETAEQVSKLVASECKEGQGPLFGASLSLAQIHALLSQIDATQSILRQNRVH